MTKRALRRVLGLKESHSKLLDWVGVMLVRILLELVPRDARSDYETLSASKLVEGPEDLAGDIRQSNAFYKFVTESWYKDCGERVLYKTDIG